MFRFTNEAGMVVHTQKVEAKKELNSFNFDYSISKKCG